MQGQPSCWSPIPLAVTRSHESQHQILAEQARAYRHSEVIAGPQPEGEKLVFPGETRNAAWLRCIVLGPPTCVQHIQKAPVLLFALLLWSEGWLTATPQPEDPGAAAVQSADNADKKQK